VVPGREVPVEGREDRVLLALLYVLALPLADAGPARVREHLAADRLEHAELTVAPDRHLDLVRPRRHEERGLRLAAVLARLLGDVGVGLEERTVLLRDIGERGAPGDPQISVHLAVEREDAPRRAELGAHVADRRLAGARDRARAGAEVFDDAVRAALHGQDAA